MTVSKRQNDSITKKIHLQCGFQISRAGRLTVKYHKGTFWSDVNILYHDIGDGYMIVCIYQISSNCSIKFMNYMYVNDTSIKLSKVNLIKRLF